MFKKTIAVAVLAAVAILGIPTAANAAYGPGSTVIVSDESPAPGGQTTVTFTDNSFKPNEQVNFTVDGVGQPSIAALAGTASVAKPASSTGAASVVVTIPTNGSGTYTITGTGATSGIILSAKVDVTPTADGVAYTGSTIPVLWIWVGSGALALGIAMVVILAITRRRQARN